MQLDSDSTTLDFYRGTAPSYVTLGKGAASRHLPEFLKLIPAKATILELGCGGGFDALAMIAAGHSVDATDGAPEMAELAEKRLGQAVRVMRFDEPHAVNAYDAIWANASLLHVPRASLVGVLRLIHAALKAGGHFCATYKKSDAEGRDQLGRYFNFLSPEIAAEFYASSGSWNILSVTEYLSPSWHSDRIDPWIAILAEKPA